MSIKPSFTCVACKFGRLPFDPQESAGTCPECGQVYLDQPERISKRVLRLLISAELVEEDGQFSVSVPDMPEICTGGATREAALYNARDAIVCVLESEQVLARPALSFGLAFPFNKPDGSEMPDFEQAAEDLVELVEKAAEVDPELRAEIEGEDEQDARRAEKEESEQPPASIDLSALDHIKRAVRWTSH